MTKVSEAAAAAEIKRRIDKAEGNYTPPDQTDEAKLAFTMSTKDLCEIAGVPVPERKPRAKKVGKRKAKGRKPRQPMGIAAEKAADASGADRGSADWWAAYRACTAEWREKNKGSTEKPDLRAV